MHLRCPEITSSINHNPMVGVSNPSPATKPNQHLRKKNAATGGLLHVAACPSESQDFCGFPNIPGTSLRQGCDIKSCRSTAPIALLRGQPDFGWCFRRVDAR